MVKEEDQSNEPPTQSPSLQEQSYVNDRDVVSFPLQHVGKITVIFLSIPSQPFFPLLQIAKSYILLQIVIGMSFSMHVFPVEVGVYPGELAVVFGMI